MKKVIDKIKKLYSNNKEFKRDFDRDREAAIKKHLGSEDLSSIKSAYSTKKVKDGKVSAASMDHVAGGKRNEKDVVVEDTETTTHRVEKNPSLNIDAHLAGNLIVGSVGTEK